MVRELEGYIEVICEFEGVQPLWYMARGHVSKEEFQSECVIEFGKHISLSSIIYAYVRAVPAGVENQSMLCLAKGRGRGAFPITYTDIVE